ncbi:primosomal protein N' [Pontibacterium granulatum]|uniref:primosomal protein N' n=1 Tax=Pontibacterium granulatum TaxID=2036029 RepID=UPI00249B9A42|nr:primosomal protein N' [Pontibacterium granulatum]MDI3324686.1 primosomal protein N' [Pontibacterium granulatum]
MVVLRLALPTPMRRLFDYLPPAGVDCNALKPGVRLRVPFGNRQLVGLLIEVSDHSEFPEHKLKVALELLDHTPPLPQHLFDLARWAANYYQHPIGDALAQALPVMLRKGNACEYLHEHLWRACANVVPEDAGSRAKKQQALLALLIKHPHGISNDAIRAEGYKTEYLRPLEEKGLAERFTHHPHRANAERTENLLHEAPLTLNEQQQGALDEINDSIGFAPILLEGITGSGKTEIYLQAIERQLGMGNQALVLVPEIGLTPQTVTRFKQRFNVPVVALHSNMTDRQRLDAWLDAREGEARIIIGTRSAIFTPMKAPGIIIVDEEHDPSFKQQDGYRYSARDLAVFRAQKEDVAVVLGSATPSLETLHNAQQGRYQWMRVTQRAGNAKAPTFELLDTRNIPVQAGLSTPLVQRIRQTLDQGTQVLVFINRRGFSPALSCHDCGWIADCNRCDAHMTLHRSPPHLHCHHCDKQTPIPARCGHCGSDQLKPVGAGTERTEDTLQKLFPDVPVLRIDRDTTQRKDAMAQMMQQIHTGEPCILVGTQMLAKGHHFPKVTLVAILNADSGLFSADFRGMERTAQLILQVAGRAGRADHPGTVIMQTHHADHPTLQHLVQVGYYAFAQQELIQRQQAQLPPFTHYALVRAEANGNGRAEAFLRAIREQLESDILLPAGVRWLGPFPSPMEKRAGMHRAQLLIQGDNRRHLHQLLESLTYYLELSKEARQVRWSIDVDPVDTF